MNELPDLERDDQVVRALLAPLERIEPVTSPDGPARVRRSKRVRFARRLAPAFVLAAVALVIGLIAPWQNGPSITERALAAIGNGPVIHAVLRNETGFTYIDLATGQETSQLETTEIWYDSERRFEHWQSSIDGRLQYDVLETPTGITTSDGPFRTERRDPKLDPALAEFIDGYRSALEHGAAREIGPGTVNGHDVTWIEFALYPPSRKWQEAERVAVDSGSSLPLRIERYHDGREESSADVVSIETLREGGGDFTAPKEGFLISGGRRDHLNPVTPAGAIKALPNAVWVGDSISGLSLNGVTRVTLTTQYTPGSGLKPRDSNGVEIHYGNGWPYPDAAVIPDGTTPDGSFVWLEETTTATLIYSIEADPNLAAPPAGSMLLQQCLASAKGLRERGCHGLVFENGVYVYIRASDRDLLLEAARALKPIDGTASQAPR